MIEQALYKRLHDDATIAGLVGTRIEPEASAQSSTLPRIVYVFTSKDYDRTLTGSTPALCKATIDIDCIATTYFGAKTLADAVRTRLDRFRGNVADVTAPAFDETVNWTNLLDDDDGYSQPADGSGKGEYWIRQTYEMWYGTSIPTGT